MIIKQNSLLILLVFICYTSIIAQLPQLEWAISIGGNSSDVSYGMDLDVEGNIYTTGHFQLTADFDPGAGIHELQSKGMGDIYIQKTSPEGNLLWVKQIGGISSDASFYIASDESKYLYIVGVFRDVVDFDPSLEEFIVTSEGGALNANAFILKLDTAGSFIWVRTITGVGDSRYYSLSLSKNGNIYLTGSFSDSADFDPGVGIFNIKSNNNSDDIFIQKLDTAGNFIWAKSMGSPFEDIANTILVDPLDNIYIAGYYQTQIDFDPGIGTQILNSIDYGTDAFVLKLTGNGDFLWVESIGGSGIDNVSSLVQDRNSDYIYVLGDYSGTIDMDPGDEEDNITSDIYYDLFIQKLDTSGNFVWAKTLGRDHNDYSTSVKVDKENNLCITGMSDKTYVINNNTYSFSEVFICKMNQDGNALWTEYVGGFGQSSIGFSVAIDETDNNIYVSGNFTGNTDFAPGLDSFKIQSKNSSGDAFLLKWNQTGNTNINHTVVNTKEFKIYPNPTSGEMYIDLNEIYDEVEMEIMKGTGSIIKKSKFLNTKIIYEDFSFPAGIYIVKLMHKGEILGSYKVLKN